MALEYIKSVFTSFGFLFFVSTTVAGFEQKVLAQQQIASPEKQAQYNIKVSEPIPGFENISILNYVPLVLRRSPSTFVFNSNSKSEQNYSLSPEEYEPFKKLTLKSLRNIAKTEIGRKKLQQIQDSGMKITFVPSIIMPDKSAMKQATFYTGQLESYVVLPIYDYQDAKTVDEFLNYICYDEDGMPYIDTYEKSLFHELVHAITYQQILDIMGIDPNTINYSQYLAANKVQLNYNVVNSSNFPYMTEQISVLFEAGLSHETDFPFQRPTYYSPAFAKLNLAKDMKVPGKDDSEILKNFYKLNPRIVISYIQRRMEEKTKAKRNPYSRVRL